MKEAQITLAVIDYLNEIFPGQKAVINFLMDLLSIPYEVAYRRVKAKIPFRLYEVFVIANHLNCSIDNMVNRTSVHMELFEESDPMQQYIITLKKDLKNFKHLFGSKDDIEVNVTVNRIPFKWFAYPTLFQLEYFTWLHRHRRIFSNQSFSDIVIPDEIQSLHNECVYYMQRLNNNIKICFNDQIFESIIQHITYYRQMQKISDQCLSKLLDELTDICHKMQLHLCEHDKKFLINGTFYYTQLPININSMSVKYDYDFFVAFWLYDSVPVIYQNDSNMFNIYQNWFNGQMFVSQLVSGTNSLMQELLLLKMQGHLKTIRNLIS